MGDDDNNRRSSWSFSGSTFNQPFELEAWQFYQHKDCQLQLMTRKPKGVVFRRPIDITESQRLSYIASYSTSLFKMQSQFLQQMNYTRFFWVYILNMIMRSIPKNYLHTFLAAYSPDDHLFSGKVIPLFTGASWQILLATLLQLVMSADILALLVQYGFYGLLRQNPWHLCQKKRFKTKNFPHYYACLTADEFINVTSENKFLMNNVTASECDYYFVVNFYKWCRNAQSGKTGYFQMSVMAYFLYMWQKTSYVVQYPKWICAYIFLWVAAGLFYRALFKKFIWKSMKLMQWITNTSYVLAILFIIWSSMKSDMQEFPKVSHTDVESYALDVDFDYFAESISAPPIIQLLNSRRTDKIHVGRDSLVTTGHIAATSLLLGVVYYKLKTYVEAKIHGPVMVSWFNPFPVFYFWPIFFQSILLGSVISRAFYLALFLFESIVFVITYQAFVEVIVCEFKYLKRWSASLIISILGVIMSISLKHEVKRSLYIFSTAITSMCENVVVCWLYPFGRLSDDLYFHHGTAPHPLRMWSLKLLPLYSIYKVYLLFRGALSHLEIAMKNKRVYKEMVMAVNGDQSGTAWAWLVPVVPLLLGGLYAIVVVVFVKRQKWQAVLKPRPDWGPKEHVTRQLRKQFDSREFITSQASRYLSRHLMDKAETQKYRLEIRYPDREKETRPL